MTNETGRLMIWLVGMVPGSLLFTGLGVYAWKRKKPMWFWSGSTVEESEIKDVPAYNRANGIMWLGCLKMKTGGIILLAGCFLGVPLLPLIYGRIYRKYKKQ